MTSISIGIKDANAERLESLAASDVVWYVKAVRDLERAIDYIHAENPAVATPVDQRLRSAVGHLDRFLDAGRLGCTPGTREIVLPEYPYVIRYRVIAEQVQILRILHTSRRWPD